MHRIKHISVFIVCLIFVGGLLGFAVDRSGDSLCQGFDVQVLGDADVHFVNTAGLVQFIHDHGHRIVGDTMAAIDTHTMEDDILTIPYVESVEVYKTIDHKVMVEVTQRTPVLRLFFNNGTSVYVDDKGKYMTTCESYSHKCLPVTGLSAPSMEVLAREDIGDNNAIHDLWVMGKYIAQNDFWNAQIMQVEMNDPRGAVIIPRVGNHEIVLGETKDFHHKFTMLEEFYGQGIEQTNWNIYKSLDLRFEDQVVAVKR